MAVVKVTASKKGVQFIDEEGNVFGTSVAYLQSLLAGTLKTGFILLQRMPFQVHPDRFAKSPVWDNNGKINVALARQEGTPSGTVDDAFSVIKRKENKEVKVFEDKKVW